MTKKGRASLKRKKNPNWREREKRRFDLIMVI
jgi:hypothetical protein